MKKKLIWWLLGLLAPVFLILSGGFFTFLLISGGAMTHKDCVQNSLYNPDDATTIPSSVAEFVQGHQEAYLLSWHAGGFLPSASIAQTMVENGFNFTNPSGTSLWQAHNMGGVKTSRLEDFPVTLATFGPDAVDVTGTKPGTNVGDNTAGAYTYFKDYNAGIVGKAEFMAHQSLYTGAINNTDGLATLTAIYNGGWATDPTYLMKLQATYTRLGKQFQWLDQAAIQKYGTTPYQGHEGLKDNGIKLPALKNKTQRKQDCLSINNPVAQAESQHSAPLLALPEAYQGKLALPLPDNNNYPGNRYPFAECTWGAYNRMAQIGQPIEWFAGDGGNGGAWGASARARGYTVVTGKPQVGWAASVPGGVAGSDPTYGHVCVVEAVNPDGSILVSETNVMALGSGTRSWRVLDAATVSQIDFIQGKGGK